MVPYPPSEMTYNPRSYLTHPTSGVWSWMTTVDHKRIGVMFLWPP
jgi:hypothetical protein